MLSLHPGSTAAYIWRASLSSTVRTALQTDHAEWISNDLCTLQRVLHQPMHTVRQQPARKLQQLATDVHTDAGDPRTTQRRFARTIAGCIYRPNQTTAVRTIRAYRRTSLCNRRAHSFAQLPQHLTGTSNSACTRTASSWLHTLHRNSGRECHNCSVVLWPKPAWMVE
jgi:hypothetical protein